MGERVGLIPEMAPEAVGAEDAELGHGVGIFREPCGAGLFEPGLEHMAVAAFDHPGADGQF